MMIPNFIYFFNMQKQQRCLAQTYSTHLGIQNYTVEQENNKVFACLF